MNSARGEPAGEPVGELPAIPGAWIDEPFDLGRVVISLRRPADPDAFLDEPEVLAANHRDDYMPYWCHVWPACYETARALVNHSWSPATRVLEIGAGLALPGLAALAIGLDVTISDYDPDALQLVRFNARRQGCETRLTTLLLDWRQPQNLQYDLIVGCEVIYERRNHPLVLDVLDRMLAPGGEAWISDPGRHTAHLFLEDCRARGYAVRTEVLARLERQDSPPGQTNLYRLSRVFPPTNAESGTEVAALE
ncbi:MAG: class I SAM-dependent methyltransferase [Planctomycetaceae bacterium]